MAAVTRKHFERAVADIAEHGDNDTLPFDIDTKFVADKRKELVDLAFDFSNHLAKNKAKAAKKSITSASIFSERLLAPTGPSGFRIVSKIHPFWSIYYNGLCVAIAEALESTRSERAHSYRFVSEGTELFDRKASWRAFREATVSNLVGDAVVVQTDISSFYEHIYHHRLENRLNDMFPEDPTVAVQVDRILSRLASGRSFGLPVGGQGSRVLAEVLLAPIDQQLDELGLDWRRFVDDFVLITSSQAEAYKALSVLSNALADYGLSLNRSKTTLLSASHYEDYVNTQLGIQGDETAQKLVEIDLYFDPYSDDAHSEFEELKEVVDSLDIRALLERELKKSQPDSFLVSQISRTLRLHDSETALQLCRTLLSANNLHAFRGSWSTLMRGVSTVRSKADLRSTHAELDTLLDAIPQHSSHLLMAEASCLHYLRTLRFDRTPARAAFVKRVYNEAQSQTVKRACIDCWRQWKDRASFTRERNQWNALGPEQQRMLWCAAPEFGDEGQAFRQQVQHDALQRWKLGIERKEEPSFASIYCSWELA